MHIVRSLLVANLVGGAVVGLIIWWTSHVLNDTAISPFVPLVTLSGILALVLVRTAWKGVLIVFFGMHPWGRWGLHELVFLSLRFQLPLLVNGMLFVIALGNITVQTEAGWLVWAFGIGGVLVFVAWCFGMALLLNEYIIEQHENAWLAEHVRRREAGEIP